MAQISSIALLKRSPESEHSIQHRRGNSGGMEIGEVEEGWFACLPSKLTHTLQIPVDGLISGVITE
jgi:hypothetical protein